MGWLLTVLWYAALVVGITRAYSSAVRARHAVPVLEKARHSARALFACGCMLWVYTVLTDDLPNINSPTDVMGWLGFIGGSAIWAGLILVPTGLPLRLLLGNPGARRCWLAAFVARGVSIFACAVVAISPAALLFATSASEFLGGILTVAIPMSVLIYAAFKTGQYASRAPQGFFRGKAGD